VVVGIGPGVVAVVEGFSAKVEAAPLVGTTAFGAPEAT